MWKGSKQKNRKTVKTLKCENGQAQKNKKKTVKRKNVKTVKRKDVKTVKKQKSENGGNIKMWKRSKQKIETVKAQKKCENGQNAKMSKL